MLMATPEVRRGAGTGRPRSFPQHPGTCGGLRTGWRAGQSSLTRAQLCHRDPGSSGKPVGSCNYMKLNFVLSGFQEPYPNLIFTIAHLCGLRGRGKRGRKTTGGGNSTAWHLSWSTGNCQPSLGFRGPGSRCALTISSFSRLHVPGPWAAAKHLPIRPAAVTGLRYRHNQPCCALSACCQQSRSCQNGSHRDFQSSDELQVRERGKV